MKIATLKRSNAGTAAPTIESIELSPAGQDTFSAVVPMVFGSLAARQVKVTVQSQVQSTKSGTVRAMVKVSFPYTPVTSGNNNGVMGDTTRASRDISFHTVVTLPKAAITDCTVSSSTAALDAARAQICVLAALHEALIAPVYIAGFSTQESQIVSDGSTGFLLKTAAEAKQTTIAAIRAWKPDETTVPSSIPNGIALSQSISGFTGVTGIEASAPNAGLFAGTGRFFARLMSGLAPINNNDEFGPTQTVFGYSV